MADNLRSYNLSKIMPDANELENYYKTLTDQELLNLKREGGFTDEAEQVLANELKRRNLTSGDLKRAAVESERSNLREEVEERGGVYRSFGLQFFGRSYISEADREANIQLRTKWFTMSGIPLVPIASYRFKCTGSPGKWSTGDTQQRVIDRIPLNWGQVCLTWVKTATILFSALLLIVAISWCLDHWRH
jgi:hypothetical protein